MNNNFLIEIFSSDSFREDYNVFLAGLDDSMYADNYQKIERFLVYIEECAEKGTYKDIGKFKRLPWLRLWIEKTKEIGCDLVYYAKRNTLKRKSKKESPTKNAEPSITKLVKTEETPSESTNDEGLSSNT